MDKLKMHSKDKTQENFDVLQKLFPNAVTETITGYDEDGKAIVERAIDKDVLQQEINAAVVEGRDERYQFTWPDKKRAIISANAPIKKTLRPCREESVDFDNTENLYIEGDNLEVLKLLQETYLGKIKMIYIDPPYNTGHDFVYNDKFSVSPDEWDEMSGELDEYGNRLTQNTESNGRFHTDWLNMIYPRLKIAKNLLCDKGAIFIHIDENEVYTLSMICNEIFGSQNELGTIVWDKRNPKGAVAGVAYQHESILVYCKNIINFSSGSFLKKKEHADAMLKKVEELIKKCGGVTETVRKEYKQFIKQNKDILSGGESAYSLIDDNGNIYQPVSMAAPDKPETRSHKPLIHPRTQRPCPVPTKGWRFTDQKMEDLLRANKIEFGADERTQPRQKYFLEDNMEEAFSSLLYYGGSDTAMDLPFDNPKPVYVANKLISSICKENSDIILDFFSGSATTAHAVMRQNFLDVYQTKKGKRKFIMVQLPEKTDEKSEAYKAGYKNICEIGKERIRRAGEFEKKNLYATAGSSLRWNKERKAELGDNYVCPDDVDIGFRVLKLDSSNMKDVYYNPADFQKSLLDTTIDNIKEDRTPEDLLFQVMLDLGVLLSEKIEENEIAGKKVFNVANGYLIACFDSDVNEAVITAVAKQKPIYFVMRDSSLSTDTTATNFDQIFETYSPDTVRKVI